MKYKAYEHSYMHDSGCNSCSNHSSQNKPYYVTENEYYEKPKCKGEKEMGYYGDYYEKDCCKKDYHEKYEKGCCNNGYHKEEKCDCCCTPGVFKELKRLEGDTVLIYLNDALIYATLICVDCDIAKINIIAVGDDVLEPGTGTLGIVSSISVCKINAVAKYTRPAA